MTDPDFKAIWVPRIGANAADELRRARRVGMSAILASLVFAAGASIALAGDSLDKVLAIALLAAMVGAFAIFIDCQRRLGRAVSAWFGVKVTGGRLPKMNPKRFDIWAEERGLQAPVERQAHVSH